MQIRNPSILKIIFTSSRVGDLVHTLQNKLFAFMWSQLTSDSKVLSLSATRTFDNSNPIREANFLFGKNNHLILKY